MGKEGVVNENRTIEELERFRRLIADLDNESDFDDKMDVLIRLKKAINDAFEDKLISEQMYRDYQEVFDNHRRGMELHPQDLQEIVSRHLNQVGDVIDQMTKSITLDTNAVETQEEEDSEEYLQAIKDAMERYANAYAAGEHNGALSAVDKFSEIGDTIKKAVSENKLTHVTADELIGPLQEMKDNLFDKAKQNEAYDLFQQIITEKMSRQKENQNQNAEEKPDNTTGSVLGNIIDGVARGLSAINQKIEERAKAAADEHDEQQAQQSQTPSAPQESTLKKKQQNIDVYSEKPKDLMAREDKVQKKDPQTKEEALWKLKDLWSELNRARQDWVENQTVDRLKKSNDLWTKFHEALRNPLLEDFVQEYDSVKGPLVNGLKNYDVIQQKIDRAIQKAQSERHAEEHDGQQKKDAQNKSPLSPEQIEQFESLKEEFLRRYHRAQVYHRNFQSKDWPVSAPFWENTVGAMEPLANMFKGLDLKEVTDTKQLEDLARQWGKTMADMSQVYNWLDNQRAYDGAKYTDDVAYDDVWGNRDELDDAAKQFFTGIGLNQQQGKETPKKEYVKPETKVEQKQPEPKQPQEEIKTAPVPETPHDTVDGKKQEKKDVAQEPEDVLKREDKVQEEVVSQEKPQEKQNTNEAAIARLRQIVDMFDRQNSDESFKKMMFALKEVADSKMVPDEMVDAYRAIFENVKKHGNTERGIFDLSTELYNQIDELQNPEDYRVASEENTPKKPEKVMTHEDVAQKESDLKPKSDKEIEQQTEVREDMMVRKDARPGNVDEKDKKQQVQHKIDNFTNGNQKVLDMDNKRENSKKELNQAALAAYRRRVLEGRGTSNV